MEDALAQKKKVMGFGHRVYKHGDSRVPTMKQAMDAMIAHFGREEILGLYNGLEQAMDEAKGIKPNLDYPARSEEHTSELQSRFDLVCRLLLEKKKTY